MVMVKKVMPGKRIREETADRTAVRNIIMNIQKNMAMKAKEAAKEKEKNIIRTRTGTENVIKEEKKMPEADMAGCMKNGTKSSDMSRKMIYTV